MRDAVKAYRGQSCLEIGFGSGSNLPQLCDQFEEVAATDVIRSETRLERPRCAEIVYADRATCFRDASFDLVVFNPPYLPSEGLVDRAVDGGRGGIEVPISFMEEAVRTVRRSGAILCVLSSEGDVEEFLNYCARGGLAVKLLEERGLFFETLFAYEVRRACPQSEKTNLINAEV